MYANFLKYCFRKLINLEWKGSFNGEIHTRPPAAQAATRANWPSSFFNLLAAVVTKRTPVAPNGCPSDREPPHELNLSILGAPT